jgi:hypothetical protein
VLPTAVQPPSHEKPDTFFLSFFHFISQ